MGIYEKIRAANEQENREESAENLADAIELLIIEHTTSAINFTIASATNLPTDVRPKLVDDAKQRLVNALAEFAR